VIGLYFSFVGPKLQGSRENPKSKIIYHFLIIAKSFRERQTAAVSGRPQITFIVHYWCPEKEKANILVGFFSGIYS
jgi:hypothetical protein